MNSKSRLPGDIRIPDNMVIEKEPDASEIQGPEKNPLPNYGHSLHKADFAQRPMSMKKFLEPFDHGSLTNTEAGEKYAAYKASYARQQLEEFFERNKAYAWFREKYHPDYCTESASNTKLFEKRLEIFMEFYKNGYFNSLHLTSGYEKEIVRLLDMVAIKLAGGTDEDFQLLDKFVEQQNLKRSDALSHDKSKHRKEKNTKSSSSSDEEEEDEDKDKLKSNKKAKKKTKRRTNSHNRQSKSEKLKIRKMKKLARRQDHEEGEEDSSSSKDDESNSSGSDSDDDDSRHTRSGSSSSSSSSASNNDNSSSESSSSGSSDDDEEEDSDGNSDSSSNSGSSRSSSNDEIKNKRKHNTTSGSSSSHTSDSDSESETNRKQKKKHSKLSKKPEVNAKAHSSQSRRRRQRNHENRQSKNVFTFSSLENQQKSEAVNDESKLDTPEEGEMDTTFASEDLTDHLNDSKSIDMDNSISENNKFTEEANENSQKNYSTRRNEQIRHPIHCTALLFLPHIPFNIFKRDLISVFSTSPHFLRLAVLDPVIMPDKDSPPITDPDEVFVTVKNALPKILLKRLGWASFVSQYKDDTTTTPTNDSNNNNENGNTNDNNDGDNKWVNIDLTVIRNQLIQHAIDCNASSEIIDCLRLSRPINEPFKISFKERARNSGELFRKLLNTCPTSIRSKALVRRHLVMAARVIHELDKARGLWLVDCSNDNTSQHVVSKDDERVSSENEDGVKQDDGLTTTTTVTAAGGGEDGEEGEEGRTITGELKGKENNEMQVNNNHENKLSDDTTVTTNTIATTVHSPNHQDQTMEVDKPETSVNLEETLGEHIDDSEMYDSFQQKGDGKPSSINDVSMNSDDKHTDDNSNNNNNNNSDIVGKSNNKSASVESDNLIDPGRDLIKAANILNTIKTTNPILQGLTDYLVDEGSAEEELLLLGGMESISFQPSTLPQLGLQSSLQLQKFEISSKFYESDDSELLVALDRLILYLRIVHSVDFYAPAIYINEDLMPHPCHLMHIRPSLNEITQSLTQLNNLENTSDIESIGQLFTNQLKRLIRLITPLKEIDCKNLGFRNAEEVAEEFIKLNTRRKKRKTDVIWVCPLSNKKFRDPIYVKKHILNKHMDKVEAAKNDNAHFFNNYLMDPARPQLPSEPRSPRKSYRSPSPSRETARESSRHDTKTSDRERSDSWNQGSQKWQQYGRIRNDRGGGGRDNLYNNSSYSRPYGGQQYSNFRIPYGGNQRSYYNGPRAGGGYGNFNRRPYPRRSYVDLDAP
uniref:Uncharacterized protein n=1 Tax=Trichobilharzia regenti TaxID=157069 RepID=A0AA85J0B1_TRIRE|nr:unnamed protein product [Trichobilharzia regenti]